MERRSRWAAYGEYLLLDPGYYKPDEQDNAKTAHSPAHNLVLIDGKAAPDKGLLTDFGDADAFLRNTLDGSRVKYAEAWQDYQSSHVERSVVFVDGRYFLVADRIQTTATGGAKARIPHEWLRGPRLRRNVRAPRRRRPMGAHPGGRRRVCRLDRPRPYR